MSTAITAPLPEPSGRLARRERPFTVNEYHALAAAGILTEDDRVELLDGRIIAMSPLGSKHLHGVNRLVDLFAQRLYAHDEPPARLSVQNPVRLNAYSEPEGDRYAEDATHERDDALTVAALPDLDPIPVSDILQE